MIFTITAIEEQNENEKRQNGRKITGDARKRDFGEQQDLAYVVPSNMQRFDDKDRKYLTVWSETNYADTVNIIYLISAFRFLQPNAKVHIHTGKITPLKGGQRTVRQGEDEGIQNGPRMFCCSFISRNEFKWSLNSVKSEANKKP